MNRRATNFASHEVDKLLALVDKYKNILGNRKTDRTSTEEKNDVWKKVEREYNTNFRDNRRSDKVLRTKYENIKRRARRNLDKVGRGFEPESLSKVDERILAICKSATQYKQTSPLSDVRIGDDSSEDSQEFHVVKSPHAEAEETENEREYSVKCEETEVAADTAHETDNDTSSILHLPLSKLNKSKQNDPLRGCRVIASNDVLRQSKNRKIRNARHKKEFMTTNEALSQQRDLHELELKKIEQNLTQRMELHKLNVRRIEQDLAQQMELHKLEVRRIEQNLTYEHECQLLELRKKEPKNISN